VDDEFIVLNGRKGNVPSFMSKVMLLQHALTPYDIAGSEGRFGG
jgi:hypothetical protein